METDADQLGISSHMGLDANLLSMADTQHGTLGLIEQHRMAIQLTVILFHMGVDANPPVILSGIPHGIRGPTSQQHVALLLTGFIPHLQALVEVTVTSLEASLSAAILHLEILRDVIAVQIQTMLSHRNLMDV